MTIHRKAVEQYFTVVLFIFQFFAICNFGLGTVRSDQLYVALKNPSYAPCTIIYSSSLKVLPLDPDLILFGNYKQREQN